MARLQLCQRELQTYFGSEHAGVVQTRHAGH